MGNILLQAIADKHTLRRVAPALAFALALCLLVICCYDAGYTGLPPTEKRYAAAKAGVASLKLNENKNRLREPWETFAREFRSIYDGDPGWPNRPAALFRAAETLEELAKRSCARADARQAINSYELLAQRHASSRLADDALFRAASMRAAWLRDEKGALILLERLKKQYPNGDMLNKAIALEKAIKAAASGKAAPDALRAAARGAKTAVDSPAPAPVAPKAAVADPANLPLRFRAAKTKMTALRGDDLKSCWRQPWESLREEFLKIRIASKDKLAPAALFHAAECQRALAACSRVSTDAKRAIDLYLELTREYPASAYADDALLAAARVHQTIRNGKNSAISLLHRLLDDYPSGDMVPEAKKFLTLLKDEQKAVAAVAAKTATPTPAAKPRKSASEVQVLSWDSHGKNKVEIVLEMSAPVKYTARLVEAAKGASPHIVLDLDNAVVINDVRKGVTVQGSLLKAVRVHEHAGGASLRFDFREVRGFDARMEDDPCRLVLSVAAGKQPPANAKAALAVKSGSPKPASIATRVSNMASQLGLTVHKVFIDAGHGGKDPGTIHNNIFERAITLDVALALGRLLQANGLEVTYSRLKDHTVALSERTRMANAAHADLFISIHVNAHDNPAINGFETYYLNLASNPQAARVAMLENAASDRRLRDMQGVLADVMLNARVDESRRLANDIQRLSLFRMKKREFPTRGNGVKSAPFHVLVGAQMPAVLVELGYCTNSTEAKNLASPKYRHALAEGLAEGILAYRDRLLKNRTARNALTEKHSDAM